MWSISFEIPRSTLDLRNERGGEAQEVRQRVLMFVASQLKKLDIEEKKEERTK
jgi:hypothetical protein